MPSNCPVKYRIPWHYCACRCQLPHDDCGQLFSCWDLNQFRFQGIRFFLLSAQVPHVNDSVLVQFVLWTRLLHAGSSYAQLVASFPRLTVQSVHQIRISVKATLWWMCSDISSVESVTYQQISTSLGTHDSSYFCSRKSIGSFSWLFLYSWSNR